MEAKKPLAISYAVGTLMLAAFLYVASYPIGLKMDPNSVMFSCWGVERDAIHTNGYQPVEWLIDNTPIYEPMKRLCKFHDVEWEMEARSQYRQWNSD